MILAGFGLALIGFGFNLLGFGLDLGWLWLDFSFHFDSKMHKNFNCCSFLGTPRIPLGLS